MPKIVTRTDLQSTEDALRRHAGGISLLQLQKELGGLLSRRTLSRRISALLNAGRIRRTGEARSTRYVYGSGIAGAGHHIVEGTSGASHAQLPAHIVGEKSSELAVEFETPEGIVTMDLSRVARDIWDYVSRPVAARAPRGYERRLLDEYEPNKTSYLPDRLKLHLHKRGKPIIAERAAGTFARDILNRFLIDFSWASSRLEGNT